MTIRFFMGSILLVIFAYFVFRKIVRSDYKNRHKLSTKSYVLEIVVFALHANMIYFSLPVQWPEIPPLPENLLLITLSSILFIIGILILLFSWFQLGTKTSLGGDKNQLVSSGFYSHSRNPQLLGYGILLLSIAILYLSSMSILWFVSYIIISAFMIRSEEEFLEEKYGQEFQDFCKRVPRIIGK